MKNMKRIKTALAAVLVLAMCLMTGCGAQTDAAGSSENTDTVSEAVSKEVADSISVETVSALRSEEEVHADYPDAHIVILSDEGVTMDGETLEEFDYTWHADPSVDHDEVKNSPAEYYTGTEPETDAAAYVAHDIFYYPQLDEDGFRRVSYDGETEWCYYYTAEGYEDFIFATLPLGTGGMSRGAASLPTEMMHSEEDAYANPVLHITQAGKYILEGSWQGQIWVDLGDSDEVFTDENARVTLILNDVDITCTVAPAVVFYSVYECDNAWEDRETYTSDVDLSEAGARVILVDGSVNNISGTNVFRMLKTKFKDEEASYEGQAQKKARKTDAAFYSYMSMCINGETNGDGTLNITAGFEGLDTELHLAINGGIINVFSQDDGINVNEDGVSVVAFNGGSVHILGGLGTEGDGVDSNGFLVVNGGTVIASASPMSDSGLDSDCGSYINGGTVLALGSTMDWAESDGTEKTQAVMNLRFSSYETADEEIEVRDASGNTVFYYEPEDDSIISGHERNYMGAVISCPQLKVGETYTVYVGGVQQGYGANGGMGHGGPGMGGFDPSRMQQGGQTPPELPDGQTAPDGQTPPEGFDPSQMQQDGQTPPELPDGQTAPDGQTPPEGFDPSQMQQDGQTPPAKPDGQTAPDGQTPPDGQNAPQGGFGQGGGNGTAFSADLTTEFLLEDTVNGFSGVSDYTE